MRLSVLGSMSNVDQTPNPQTMPTLYIPHGGGPCFFMDWTMGPVDTWYEMGQWLKNLSASLPRKPKALLVISAHWEEKVVTIMSGCKPPLLFDYHGFPEHTYKLEYRAPGSPELAEKTAQLLQNAGIETRFEPDRGFDHGVFVPLKLVFPDADIPIVQLSLKKGLDPSVHLEIGRALSPLRDEGVLILGSGMSFHNLRNFFVSSEEGTEQSRKFDDWLHETLTTTETKFEVRAQALESWAKAPAARFAHPREDHLIPLMVIAGASEHHAASRIFHGRVFDIFISGYRFG
jgi:aromatic ring-opening dioxygenase catalytic subunit (LigB family)